jgi:predicted permease
MTLATILLSVSALLLHSFLRLSMADRGYETEGVLTVELSLFGSRYGAAEQRIAFYDGLRERVGALPGVTAAGAINYLPALSAAEGASRTIYREDDRPPFQALMLTRPIAMLRSITSGYFAASGTPLRAGRLFGPRETDLVCLLSESLAAQLWPQEPASAILGRRVRQAGDPSAPLMTVVGVVADVRTGAMDSRAPLSFYRPYPQWASGPMALVVRTAGPPESLVPAVRSVIRAMDADLPIAAIRTMREVLRSTVAERRFQLTVTILFAAVALLVGVIGLYGVVSYWVACRTSEIGLRIALGAARGELMRWIFVHGLMPVAVGLVVGLGSAVAIAVTLRSLLFEISPTDPLSLAAVAGVLLATSSLACYLPARRAATIDPMTALRVESPG